MIFDKDKMKKEYLMDFVSRTALSSFQEGSYSYISILQNVFALNNAKHYHIEIANAYTALLSKSTIKQLIYIEENSRHYLMYYDWNPSHLFHPRWDQVDMSRKRFSCLSDSQYLSVLKLGTFHEDGYCRQNCMKELSGHTGTLLFFMLRMNDWVKEIRELAYVYAKERLAVCDMHELISAMPILYKLKNSGRRTREHLNSIEQFINASIISKAQSMELDKVHTYDITIRNAVYRFVSANPVLSLDAMETLLHYAKDSFGKRMIIKGILEHYPKDFENILDYLNDKSGIVRYEALLYWYEKTKEPWADLTDLLMDKIKKIRLLAAYILEKHQVLHVLDHYKNALSSEASPIALYGIGEHGSYKDVTLVEPYLNSKEEHLEKAALAVYLNLLADHREELCRKYLFDNRSPFRKLAYIHIRKYKIHYGAKYLYEEYEKQEDELLRRYLLTLIYAEPSWQRLPYLLKLWGSESVSKEQADKLFIAIQRRNMYARISQEEALEIRNILEELSHKKPASIINPIKKGIEFDLRLVTR